MAIVTCRPDWDPMNIRTQGEATKMLGVLLDYQPGKVLGTSPKGLYYLNVIEQLLNWVLVTFLDFGDATAPFNVEYDTMRALYSATYKGFLNGPQMDQMLTDVRNHLDTNSAEHSSFPVIRDFINRLTAQEPFEPVTHARNYLIQYVEDKSDELPDEKCLLKCGDRVVVYQAPHGVSESSFGIAHVLAASEVVEISLQVEYITYALEQNSRAFIDDPEKIYPVFLRCPAIVENLPDHLKSNVKLILTRALNLEQSRIKSHLVGSERMIEHAEKIETICRLLNGLKGVRCANQKNEQTLKHLIFECQLYQLNLHETFAHLASIEDRGELEFYMRIFYSHCAMNGDLFFRGVLDFEDDLKELLEKVPVEGAHNMLLLLNSLDRQLDLNGLRDVEMAQTLLLEGQGEVGLLKVALIEAANLDPTISARGRKKLQILFQPNGINILQAYEQLMLMAKEIPNRPKPTQELVAEARAIFSAPNKLVHSLRLQQLHYKMYQRPVVSKADLEAFENQLKLLLLGPIDESFVEFCQTALLDEFLPLFCAAPMDLARVSKDMLERYERDFIIAPEVQALFQQCLPRFRPYSIMEKPGSPDPIQFNPYGIPLAVYGGEV
ncbi:MAG: hypothetical protein S4CHLAM102_03500 [Chlamydiia bacterium]|nr:hypothetical protein [Chlamydiia bacterium]